MRVGRCLCGEGMAKCEVWCVGGGRMFGDEKGSGRDLWDRGSWDPIPPPLPNTCIPYFRPHFPILS